MTESATATVSDYQDAGRETAALRAFLQRTEVRLSTMHRIGGAFISGAGLLVLLPLLMRDTLPTMAKVLLDAPSDASGWMMAGISIQAGVVVLLPFFALYLLFRDLVLFYFSTNIPTGDDPNKKKNFLPRFSLTAIPFADDDGIAGETKTRLRAAQFATPMKHFLLPHDDSENAWLDAIAKASPAVPLDEKEFFGRCQDEAQSPDGIMMRTAFGVAGAYNRTLLEEVAKSELSLIRHNLHLRRLVIRYMKALLLFIWTAAILLGLQIVLDGSSQIATLLGKGISPELCRLGIMSSVLLCWSGFAPFFVRAPMRWSYIEADQNRQQKTNDPHLHKFEGGVILTCAVLTLAGTVLTFLICSKAGIAIPAVAFVAMAASFVMNGLCFTRWQYGRPHGLRWV